MKKVLLASTALVAFAGAAAAEIAISGSAEMGIAASNLDLDLSTGVDTDGDGVIDTTSVSADLPLQFWQDVDVTFSMSGETDGGLAFGVSVDLDEAGNLGNQFSNQGVAVFISGDFGTLTLGDTDGAVDRVITDMGNIGNPGSINDAETGHVGYLGSWLDGSGDGQIVRYDYTFDAFSFALSVEQMPSGTNGTVLEDDEDLTWAVGFGYDFEFNGGSVDLGVGYQYSDNGLITVSIGQTAATALGIADDPATGADEDQGEFQLGGGEVGMWAVGAAVNLDGGFSGGITYTNFDFEDRETVTHIGVGLGYSFDAFSVHANYGLWDGDDDNDASGWGISAGYDLGGGASLLFGYGQSDFETPDLTGDGRSEDFSSDSYSLGLSFSF